MAEADIQGAIINHLKSSKTNEERRARINETLNLGTTYLGLAQQRLKDKFSQHRREVLRGKRTGEDFIQSFREETELVRVQWFQGFTHAVKHLEEVVAFARARLGSIRYPARDCQQMPLVGVQPKDVEALKNLRNQRSLEGEMLFLKGRRLVESMDLADVLEKIRTAAQERNVDLVSSLLEAAETKFKKSGELQKLKARLEEIDFWGEEAILGELEGLVDLLAFAKEQQTRASNPLYTEDLIDQLKKQGLADVSEALVKSGPA